jgi:segregation and condensation protein B
MTQDENQEVLTSGEDTASLQSNEITSSEDYDTIEGSEELEADAAEAEVQEARDLDEEPLSVSERIALVEALLFAHGDLVAVGRLKEVTGFDENEIRDALDTLQMKYQHEEAGIELVRIGQKFQFRTKALYGRYIRALNDSKPKKLSKQALETLAIVAYRQPLVKSDIDKIRGVDASPVLKTLLEKQLIKIVGHQATVGQPALYGTTDEFLNLFGMTAISELPSLREVKEFESEPGEPGEKGEAEERKSAQVEMDFEGSESDFEQDSPDTETDTEVSEADEPERLVASSLAQSIEVLHQEPSEPSHKLPTDVFSFDDDSPSESLEDVANV